MSGVSIKPDTVQRGHEKQAEDHRLGTGTEKMDERGHQHNIQ